MADQAVSRFFGNETSDYVSASLLVTPRQPWSVYAHLDADDHAGRE